MNSLSFSQRQTNPKFHYLYFAQYINGTCGTLWFTKSTYITVFQFKVAYQKILAQDPRTI